MSKVVVFHGVDHKVGTTLLVQSTAELIARSHRQISVMVIGMNGRSSTDYVREVTESIESFRIQIENRMLDVNHILRLCKWKENLYLLTGIGSCLDHRNYHPDHAAYLLRTLENHLDLILVDGGNEIDHGLALGSLFHSKHRYLIMTQQESMLSRYEQISGLYQELSIHFSRVIINKYQSNDPYQLPYIQKRTGLDQSTMRTIPFTEHYRQAEMDYRSLIAFQDQRLQTDLAALAWDVSEMVGVPMEKKKRRIQWKNFI